MKRKIKFKCAQNQIKFDSIVNWCRKCVAFKKKQLFSLVYECSQKKKNCSGCLAEIFWDRHMKNAYKFDTHPPERIKFNGKRMHQLKVLSTDNLYGTLSCSSVFQQISLDFLINEHKMLYLQKKVFVGQLFIYIAISFCLAVDINR